jgi:hypothetical protein
VANVSESVRNRKDLWRFVDKLRKILEKGGKAWVNLGRGDTCLVFRLDRYYEDPQNKPRFAVFVHNKRENRFCEVVEKWIDGKIELKVINPDWVRAFARDKGEIAEFYVSGYIEVKVEKLREFDRTNVEVVCRW